MYRTQFFDLNVDSKTMDEYLNKNVNTKLIGIYPMGERIMVVLFEYL